MYNKLAEVVMGAVGLAGVLALVAVFGAAGGVLILYQFRQRAAVVRWWRRWSLASRPGPDSGYPR